jgi:hypothetical protein
MDGAFIEAQKAADFRHPILFFVAVFEKVEHTNSAINSRNRRGHKFSPEATCDCSLSRTGFIIVGEGKVVQKH